LTRGHTKKVILMSLLAIPIVIAGLICLIVGIIPAIMWIQAAFASLYHAVSTLEERSGQEGAIRPEPVRS